MGSVRVGLLCGAAGEAPVGPGPSSTAGVEEGAKSWAGTRGASRGIEGVATVARISAVGYAGEVPFMRMTCWLEEEDGQGSNKEC